MAAAFSVSERINPSKNASSETSATIIVLPEQVGNRHQEQMGRTLVAQDSRTFSVPHTSHNSSLPFPLNLPPSYPVYPSSSQPTVTVRHPRPHPLRQNALLPATNLSTKTHDATEVFTRVRNAPSAPSSKGKGKRTLDAFMDSRHLYTGDEQESSSSDSELSPGNMLVLPSSDEYPLSDSSALPSSSPPSSSPIRTPRASSPLYPIYRYASSPTQKRPSQTSSHLPYILPPGPHMLEKPPWSLSALIGQALNASRLGSLALSDIYAYVSTVYPYYNRVDQSWMSSIRHNLSLQDAFERILEENGDKATQRQKNTKGRGGSWRIKPGFEACFVGGNYVKKGAKGAGPGLNHARKRSIEDGDEHADKRLKAETSIEGMRSATPVSSSSTRSQSFPRSNSQTRTIYSDPASRRQSSPPLRTGTLPSDTSLCSSHLPPSSPPFKHDSVMSHSPGSPELPLAVVSAQRKAAKGRMLSLEPSLEPGFQLSRISGLQNSAQPPAVEVQDTGVNRDLFVRVLASSSSAHASSSTSRPPSDPNPARLLFPPPFSPLSASSSFPSQPTTPPRQDVIRAAFSPSRTPVSHRGVHMSPSRSLAHYKSNLDPEWKTASNSTIPERRLTPPPHEQGDKTTSTPKNQLPPVSCSQSSPFRTPVRSMTSQRHQQGYDPYDPNMLLADELTSIRNANDPQESPGGFFGKEGRRLLYESPGVPSRSHWRFRDEF